MMETRNLEAAGVERRQAAAIANVIRDGQSSVAAKYDIVRIESKLTMILWALGILAVINLANFGAVMYIAGRLH